MLTKNWDLLNVPPYDYNLDPSQVKVGHRRCPNLKENYVRPQFPTPLAMTTLAFIGIDTRTLPGPEINAIHYTAGIVLLLKYMGESLVTSQAGHITPPRGVTCKSNNLVYVITCKKCPTSQYVGETYRPLHKRMYEHLYSIGHNGDTSVAQHFRQPGHNISHIKFEVASFIYSYAPPNSDEGTKIRRSVEKLWIHRFKTNRSPGLNILH